MFCGFCGTQCADDMLFCPVCGRKLVVPIVRQEPPVQPSNTDFSNNSQPEFKNTAEQVQSADVIQPAEQVPASPQVIYVYTEPPKKTEPGNGFAIASFICGIVSFIILPTVAGLLAVIFGGMAKSRGHMGKLSTLGMIFGIAGIAAGILMSSFLMPLLDDILVGNGAMY